MRIAQGLAAAVALLGWTGVAKAQFFNPSPIGVGNVSAGRTFSVSSFRHHHHFSAHHYYSFGIGYYPYSYWGSPFYSSGIYWYGYPAATPLSSIVINPPPADRAARQPVEEELPKGKVLIKPGQGKAKEEAKEKKEEAKEKPEPPLPGVPASVFRPVRPADRERALQPVAPEEAKPQGPPQPVEARPPEEPLPLPQPVEPAGDPKDLIRLGKEVFTAREYGRAERFFRQATDNEPKEALAFFLLAQARFALGKYQEAVTAIHAGMLLKPDWPQADFQPQGLYGPQAADFQEQLDHLKEVADKNPNDPTLAFLHGYQLWFAGRKEEAKLLFHRAEADAKERDFINQFLQPAKN
jgi:tetratricopeptide (TPR) repeat protein